MTFVVPLLVVVAFGVVLALSPALVVRTPGPLVAVARKWRLDLHADGAAGWDGALFLRIEVRPVRRWLRRLWEAEIRVRAPGLAGFSMRARRPTDFGRGLKVDHGRLDELVRVDATDPADALSRLDAKARAAVSRAITAGAELADGEWRILLETDCSNLDELLRALVTPSRVLSEIERDIDARLTTLARTDPVLEVRVECAARRAERGDLRLWEAPRLVEVLREGAAANPPVPGAVAALASLQAERAKTEAGRVSLATGDEGRLSLAPREGGELAVAPGSFAGDAAHVSASGED